MQAVYRLCGLLLWPLASENLTNGSTSQFCMYFGLYGFTATRTSMNENGDVCVEYRRVSFIRDLDDVSADMCKHFGIDTESLAPLRAFGSGQLKAPQMLEAMRVSKLALRSISPFLLTGFWKKDGVQVKYHLGSAYCTKPDAVRGATDVVSTTDFTMLAGGSVLYSLCADPYSGVVDYSQLDLSCLRVDEQRNTDPKSVYDLLKADGRGFVYRSALSHIMRSNKLYLDNAREAKEGTTSAWLKVAYSERIVPCYAKAGSGFTGAQEGLGKSAKFTGCGFAVLSYNIFTHETKWDYRQYDLSNSRSTPENLIPEDSILSGLYALPPYVYAREFLDKFKQIPSRQHFHNMLYRYATHLSGRDKGTAEKTPVATERSMMFVLMQKFASTLTEEEKDWMGKIQQVGVCTEELWNKLCGQAVQDQELAVRSVTGKLANVFRQVCDKEGAAAVDVSGNELPEDAIEYEFEPVHLTNAKGCMVRIKNIGNVSECAGLVIKIPENGEIGSRKFPVQSLSAEFCPKAYVNKLRGIILPKHLVQIGDTSGRGVFSGCAHLEVVDASACVGLQYIGKHAFESCERLHQVLLPKIDAKQSYTIHTGAFTDLPSLLKLEISAQEILSDAFTNTSVYDLTLDAVKVGSHAFGRGFQVEHTLKLGESFSEVGVGGLANVCAGKSLKVNLPNLTRADRYAFGAADTKLTCDAVVGDKLSMLGSGAFAGWHDVVFNGKSKDKLDLKVGSMREIENVQVHANTVYESEAVRSIPYDNIRYFENEAVSDERKDLDEYVSWMNAFLTQDNGSTNSVVSYVRDNLQMIMDGMCAEPEGTLDDCLKDASVVSDDAAKWFMLGASPAYTSMDVADPNMQKLLDITMVRSVRAVADAIDPSKADMYSNINVYSRSRGYDVLYASDDVFVGRLDYETSDFISHAVMYTVSVNGKGTYLFAEKSPKVSLISADDYICMLNGDPEARLREWRGKVPIAFTRGGEAAAYPFITKGDRLGKSPTLMYNSFAGMAQFGYDYIKLILGFAVVIDTADYRCIYRPDTQWYLKLDRSDDTCVIERKVGITFDEFVKEFEPAIKGDVALMRDSKEFITAATRIKTRTARTGQEPIVDVVKAFKANVDELAAKGLSRGVEPFTKDFLDLCTQKASFLVSTHDDRGALADFNNLVPHKDTLKRLKLMDGTYLQCFNSARITKGRRIKNDDYIAGDRAAFKGGRSSLWYKVFANEKDTEAIAVYTSGLTPKQLKAHFGLYATDGQDATSLSLGGLVSKSRIIFNPRTMPVIAANLTYDDTVKRGTVDGHAVVGCGIDAQTGRWYMLASDIKMKHVVGEIMDDACLSGSYYVLFPIRNISFVSALAQATLDKRAESTMDYLETLVAALHDKGKDPAAVIARYKQALSYLGMLGADSEKIMQMTDFFLAPCIG